MHSQTLTLIDQTPIDQFFHDTLRQKVTAKEIEEDEIVYAAQLFLGRARADSYFKIPPQILVMYGKMYHEPRTEAQAELQLKVCRGAGDQSLVDGGFFRARAVSARSVEVYDTFGPFF